jgi:PhnB protein
MSEAKPATLVPHLCCRNAGDAVEFYQKALGAETVGVFRMPDGAVFHAAMKIGDSSFYIAPECPAPGGDSPLTLGGTAVTLHLQVSDCDAVFERAIAAGCTSEMPLQEMFWGDRYGMLVDPFGHRWSVATTVRKVSQEEAQQAAATMAPA